MRGENRRICAEFARRSAADGEVLSDDESLLLFRGLHILGGARDRETCQPLLRLLRRPLDEVDDLIGDTVIESLANVITGVFDEDPRNGLIARSSMTTLPQPNTRPDDIDRFTQYNLGYIEDVLVSLDWTRCTEDVFDEEAWTDFVPNEPVRNPWRHVGRNDPCPCGGDKNAKKCCLAKGEPPT